MVIARRALILLSVVTIGAASLDAQRGKASPGLTNNQRKASEALLAVANDAAVGKAVPNDLALAWIHDDLIRAAQQGQTLVPFIMSYDGSKMAPGPYTVYWRVASKDAPMPAPATGKKDDKNAMPVFAYEAMNEGTAAAGGSMLTRSFNVVAGSYDVTVVVKEGSVNADPKKAPKNAPPAKVSVIKQSVTVPDLWNAELGTSSLLAVEKINTLSAPVPAQETVNRPYALGAAELVPFTRTKFTTKDQLTAFIFVYNSKGDAANRPDVKVEFNFYAKQAGAEKLFNAAPATNLNANTLPPTVMAGSMLQAGFQGASLEAFPVGDYRLEVKVTDNVAKKELKRDLNFSISGS